MFYSILVVACIKVVVPRVINKIFTLLIQIIVCLSIFLFVYIILLCKKGTFCYEPWWHSCRSYCITFMNESSLWEECVPVVWMYACLTMPGWFNFCVAMLEMSISDRVPQKVFIFLLQGIIPFFIFPCHLFINC